MPEARVNGATLFYEIDGEGTPCFVVHGGLGVDHTLYRRSLMPLAAELQLIHYDQRCNGRSTGAPLESVTIEQLADDLVALADRLAIDDFIVIGHSYGGYVAQEAALRHPGRISQLVLISTSPGQLGEGETDYQGPPPPPELVALMGSFAEAGDDMETVMRKLLPWYLHSARVEDVEPLTAGTIFNLDVMFRGFAVHESWSTVDRLHEIQSPTLVVAGRHDVFTSLPQSERIARRIPGAELVILEEGGHFPWLDQPGQFFEALLHRVRG